MSDGRQQFTFYRSYYEALKALPRKARLDLLEGIIGYALDGVEPNLIGACLAAFILIRPTLDSGRKKAQGGKNGTPSKKDGEKIPKRCGKDTVKEKEIEKEIEVEYEVEKEIDIELETETEGEGNQKSLFDIFFDAYPFRVDRDGALRAWRQLPEDARVPDILSALDKWKQSDQWRAEGGRYIPKASKWLSQGYYLSAPAPVESEFCKLGQAELEAIQRVLREDLP